MKAMPRLIITLGLICVCLPACNMHREEYHLDAFKITATKPQSRSITLTQQYVGQIHSQHHTTVRAFETGYIEAIPIGEGQPVKQGDLLFNVIPVLYQSKLDAEIAEVRLAELELNDARKGFADKAVTQHEVSKLEARLAKAQARANRAAAELNFASVKAPFDGIVDRLRIQQGSLVMEGEVLTTLSDNSQMCVYFNVPESRYLEYIANLKQCQDDLQVELVLANGKKFNQVGKIVAIEADFVNKTGNIPFRADFPNPDRLLRHGLSGTVLIGHVQNDALVVPQRATFENLNKRYVYVIDKDDVAHRREIVIQNELDDLFVIREGVGVDDKIVLEGIRQVHDGHKVEYEHRQPEQVVASLKYHAE